MTNPTLTRFQSLQNFNVFAIGCTVYPEYIEILMLCLKPSELGQLRGSVQTIVESRKIDGESFEVLIPKEYTELWIDARLERVNKESN